MLKRQPRMPRVCAVHRNAPVVSSHQAVVAHKPNVGDHAARNGREDAPGVGLICGGM